MTEKDDLATATALLRRALTRINVLERRVAGLEERLHQLDDIPETLQGLHRLVRAGGVDEDRVRELARTIASNTVDKRLKKNGR